MSPASAAAKGHEADSGQWCLQCWMQSRRRTAAVTVCGDDPYCVACALEAGYSSEDIAAGRMRPNLAAKKRGGPETPEPATPEPSAGGSGAALPAAAIQPEKLRRTTPGENMATASRTCKGTRTDGAKCRAAIGLRNTTGLCPNCYAMKNYRDKRAAGIPRATTKGSSRKLPVRKSQPCQAPILAALEDMSAVFAPELQIEIPERVIDRWWAKLGRGDKAALFTHIICGGKA